MRISDWSSDVCSSDLTQRVDQQQITRRRVVAFRSVAFLDCSEHVGIAARACVETGTCRSFGIARCIDGALERGNALQAGRGFEEQIGRASCRERGGQSVLSPVVDGALKKKQAT